MLHIKTRKLDSTVPETFLYVLVVFSSIMVPYPYLVISVCSGMASRCFAELPGLVMEQVISVRNYVPGDQLSTDD